jgi:hypothetical protein
MAEGREHRRLVRALVGHLQDCHVTVAAAAIRGWPSPQAVGARRPDVLGYCAPLGIVVAGEAKRGPELWSCRPQLAELAEALPRLGPSGTDAVLMLATLPGWEDDGRAVAASLPRYRTVISVWSPPAAEWPIWGICASMPAADAATSI